DQLPWIFHCEPFGNTSSGVPKVHAHLSEFSEPAESYHALSLLSVIVSESSCPLTLASAASPWLCSPDGSCGLQPASPSSLKKNANCTGTPPQVPALCHAQKPALPRARSTYTG